MKSNKTITGLSVFGMGLIIAIILFLTRRPYEGRPLIRFDFDALRGALLSYKAEYGDFPSLDGTNFVEVNGNLTAALTATGPKDLLNQKNPKEIPFLYISPHSLAQGC